MIGRPPGGATVKASCAGAMATKKKIQREQEEVRKRETDADPARVVASDHSQLGALLEAFVEVGASKFVVLPYGRPADGWLACRTVGAGPACPVPSSPRGRAR